MEDSIRIVPAEPQHLSQVETWVVRNEAVHTLLKTPQNPSYGVSGGQYWAALQDKEVVAIAAVELNKEHVGYIKCIVNPGYLRQGIGSQMIEYILGQPSVSNLAHLHATVESSNVAAQKILNENDFSRVGYDVEGHIEFARHKQ